MWPRFFERNVRPFLARELGAECAYGHLAAASVTACVAAYVAEGWASS